MDRHQASPRGAGLGATLAADGVAFRVWAPAMRRVEIVLEGGAPVAMQPSEGGYHVARVPGLGPGARYRYRLDGEGPYPDPASRYQPEGPHGPSMVVDEHAYAWRDEGWRGISMRGQVVYEMHVGTFTREGTFDAAVRDLVRLKDLGITCLELMPVAEFPGRFNWGYDGVDLFAPYHGYGDYDAMKRFVDAAHALGLGVILDVVYNHFGPDGAYWSCYTPHWFTDRYPNEWGSALNFEGESGRAVREFIVENARYWIGGFHLDGLRLDATQSIHDASPTHVIAEIAAAAREAAAGRGIVLVAENEPQRVSNLRPAAEGGFGLDALWNDDFHHSSRVALTGSRQGYFRDYCGTAQEFVSAVKHGFLFQGQYYQWQKKPRGTPITREPAWALVNYIQNHDQVGNTLTGLRLCTLTSPGRHRAMTALLLLAPQTPMLFMGQEYGATTPFTFFADHEPELAEKVFAGRRGFLAQFDNFATERASAQVTNPSSVDAFERSKLDPAERERNRAAADLHRDLLAIRRTDLVIAAQDRGAIDGAVLNAHAFVLRWFAEDGMDRLLVVNLGEEVEYKPAPEPLLAPPADARWRTRWSSDDPRYAGLGAVDPCGDEGWRLPAECAVLLVAEAA